MPTSAPPSCRSCRTATRSNTPTASRRRSCPGWPTSGDEPTPARDHAGAESTRHEPTGRGDALKAVLARVPAGIAAVVVLVLGLGVRGVTDGALAKDAGDALYAALAYYAVLLVRPAQAPWRAG